MRSIRIIGAIAWKQIRILSRMPAILIVIFVPGIVMYTIFTEIFKGPAGRPFRAAVIDQDGSEASRELIAALEASNVKVVRTTNEESDGATLTPETAREQIRKRGTYRVAVVIPTGYGEAPNVLSEGHRGVEVIYDETQAMEVDAILGMLQMAAGRALFEQAGASLGALIPGSSTTKPAGEAAASGEHDDEHDLLVRVKKTAVAIQRPQVASKHTFLAAIVPMFLLFGATSAARTLLEEMQSGEIIRMLAAPIAPAHLMVGSMTSTIVVAMLQCYSMYVFAWLAYGVAIWSFAGGLFLLTLITCLACTGFGMLLGSLCRTSLQLDSIGTVVILGMSAIGGSMVPRFVMPAFMQKLGLLTINGWAYDGMMNLMLGFPVREVLPECGVLLGVAVGTTAVGSVILGRRLRMGVRR